MKKGDKVILCMFTGCKTAVKEIVKADKKTVTITANDGRELVFDAKTLKQIEPAPKKPQFANYIIEDDGSFVPKPKKPRKPKKEKVSGVTKAPEEKVDPETENWEEDDDDFEEDEFVEV